MRKRRSRRAPLLAVLSLLAVISAVMVAQVPAAATSCQPDMVYQKGSGDFGLYWLSQCGTHSEEILGFTDGWDPSLATDSSFAVFDKYTELEQTETTDLYVVNTSTKAVTRLTDFSQNNEDFPRVSPNGQYVSFLSDTYLSGSTTQQGIYKIKTDGTGLTLLKASTPGQFGIGSGAAWSLDGSKLAFTAYDSNSDQALYTMNADGSGLTKVLDVTTYGTPVWTPDGNYLLYSKSSSNFQIWVTDLSGNTVQVTDDTVGISVPVAVSNDWTLNYYRTGHLVSPVYTINRQMSLADVPNSTSVDGMVDGDVMLSVVRTGTVTAKPSNFPPGSTTPVTQPTQSYVALGDSIAAGEGTNYGWTWNNSSHSWELGTASPTWEDSSIKGQYCHLSTNGYPYKLAAAENWCYRRDCLRT